MLLSSLLNMISTNFLGLEEALTWAPLWSFSGHDLSHGVRSLSCQGEHASLGSQISLLLNHVPGIRHPRISELAQLFLSSSNPNWTVLLSCAQGQLL